jgi:hypothetical protein
MLKRRAKQIEKIESTNGEFSLKDIIRRDFIAKIRAKIKRMALRKKSRPKTITIFQ